jgi:hypothetical protein
MATLLTTHCSTSVDTTGGLPETIPGSEYPGPEQVRAAAAAIRRTWSPRTRHARARLARTLLFRHLVLALFQPLEPAALPVSPAATPRRRI